MTCYGTIGHEYSYLGVPVLNASRNNPHINYNFCLHPKNKNEYKKIILNAKKLKLKIKKNEIYEFFFMRYIYNKIGYIVDLDKFFKYNSYLDLFNNKFYEFFLKNFSKEDNNLKIKRFNNFVKSKNYMLFN